jgi:hypothetical protein
MNKQKLLELVGEYGGLRDEAGMYWNKDRKEAESYMKKATKVFEQISKEIEEVPIPETITEDRAKICKIISEMLDNPDKYGIYPTTKCYNEFESLLRSVRVQALSYAWSVACGYMEDCEDIREIDQAGFLEKALKQLNKET